MPGASKSPESPTSRVKGCWAGRPVLGELPSLALGPTGPGSKLPGAGEDAFRPIGAGLSKSRRGVRLVLSHLCTCLSALSFFAAGSVPGNRSGYQCTSGWWGKGRVKAEPSEQEQPTFEVTSQLRPVPGRCAGEVCRRPPLGFTQVRLRLGPARGRSALPRPPRWARPRPAQPSARRDVPPPRCAGTAAPGGAGSLPAGKRVAGAWEVSVAQSPLLATTALSPRECGERGGQGKSPHLITAQLG